VEPGAAAVEVERNVPGHTLPEKIIN
jgi:hypothetical protein